MKKLTPEQRDAILEFLGNNECGEYDLFWWEDTLPNWLNANTAEVEGLKCECGYSLQRLESSSEPEGIRKDAFCAQCLSYWAVHKHGLVRIKPPEQPNSAEDYDGKTREAELTPGLALWIMNNLKSAPSPTELPTKWRSVNKIVREKLQAIVDAYSSENRATTNASMKYNEVIERRKRIENQIAMRKWNEFLDDRPHHEKLFDAADFPYWLQQEDK